MVLIMSGAAEQGASILWTDAQKLMTLKNIQGEVNLKV